MIFHIRKRLPRRRGSQFYRDKSERKTETLCGAPITDRDAAWHHRADTYEDFTGVTHTPCADCVRLKMESR